MGSMPEKDRITFSMALEELFARVLAEYGVNVVFKGRLSEYIAILDAEHDEYEERPVERGRASAGAHTAAK